MTYRVSTSTTRSARLDYAGRKEAGQLTIARVREFLADADAAGIPENTRVHVREELTEGANYSGSIEASHIEPEDRP